MAIDYKAFNSRPAGSGNSEKKIDYSNSRVDQYRDPLLSWWRGENEYDTLQGVKSMVGELSADLLNRTDRYRVGSRLYGVTDIFSNALRPYNSSYQTNTVVPDRLSFNVVQSNVDTLVSKMSKIKPRAKFLTNLGTFRAQNNAKKLGYFADGIFSENDVYTTSRMTIRDSLVFGDGLMHAYIEKDRVRIERVLPYELLVDENECLANPTPTHLYRIKLVDRQQLCEMYPEYKEKILQSSQLFTINIHQVTALTDQIEVLEAWRIGQMSDGGDGRHLIAVPDAILHYEPWNGKRFPIVRLSWTKPFSGYWSQSLSEQLKPTQLELNKLLLVAQRSYHLAGSFKILIQNGSQIPVESFNNNIGTIVKYSGPSAPQYITPPILPPEFYRQIDTLIQRSYQISGVSNLSATSTKPAGLDSGRALREFQDIESNRFMAFSQDLEQFFVDVAQVCLDLVQSVAEKTGGYPVNKPGPKSLTRLDWKEISMDEDSYTISVYPASSLPTTPSGRIAAVDDLVNRGLISPVEQKELLDMPDLQAASALSNAQDEYLKNLFERILEEGVYTAPEAYDNLQLARRLALQYYALAKNLNEGEAVLEMFRQFLSDLDALETPEPVIPNLPQPALGVQLPQAEAAQLGLPAATAALPGSEALIAEAAGLPLPTGG